MDFMYPRVIVKAQQLIRKWTNHCIIHHPECGNRELASVFPDTASIILIDVGQMCISERHTSDRYFALSYVWGSVPQFTTRTENRDSLLKPDSLKAVLPSIPMVIRDAIWLMRALGERYLWVDSLCIVQNDPSIKHGQLALMAEIYNSATATIIACAGADANARLWGPPVLYRVGVTGQHQLPWFIDQSPAKVMENNSKNQQSGTGILRPSDTRPFIDEITQSHHNQRGWTFQERLLSRRRIFFLNNKIVFHCRRDMFTANGEVEVKIVRDYLQMPVDRAGTFHYYDDAVNSQRGHGSEWPSGMTSTSWDVGFHFWSGVVEEYSKKKFTFDTDILDACTGILQAFQGYSTWAILQGMPDPVLDLALLWVPVGLACRRPPLKIAGTDSVIEFPTWSWLGWCGGVTFPLTGKDTHFLTVSSCVADLEVSSRDEIWKSGWLNARKSRTRGVRDKSASRKLFNWSSKAKGKSYTDPLISHECSRFLNIRTATIKGSSFTIGDGHLTWLERVVYKENFHPEVGCREYISMEGKRTCGIILGILYTQVERIRESPEKFELILLSKSLPLEHFPLFIPSSSRSASKNLSLEPRVSDKRIEKEHIFDPEQRGSEMLNVMLIEWVGGTSDLAERVAIGQISSEAWEQANPVQRTLVLR